MKRSKKVYSVYCIKHNGRVLYWGYTNNLKARTYRHNYLMKKGTNKLLYNYWNNLQLGPIVLELVREFDSKTEAKRFECLNILLDHFNGTPGTCLLQKVPQISDR